MVSLAPHSESISAVAAALVAAQGELEHASKNAANPHFRSKYADLTEVIDTIRPVFNKHGLAVLQRPVPSEGGPTVQTVIVHKSGEWIADAGLFLPAQKSDPQGFGSALTYARRYGLAALVGLAQDDDDANAASFPPTPRGAAQPSTGKPATSTGGDRWTWPFPRSKDHGKTLDDVATNSLKWAIDTNQFDPTHEQYGEKNAKVLVAVKAELERRQA